MSVSKFLLIIISPLLFITSCQTTKQLTSVTTEKECNCKKDGYWYKEKCWKNFEEEGIKEENVNEIAHQQLELYRSATINFNGTTEQLTSFLPLPEKGKFLFITSFAIRDTNYTFLSIVPKWKMLKKTFKAETTLFQNDLLNKPDSVSPTIIGKGNTSFKVIDLDELTLEATGDIYSSNETLTFNYITNDAATGWGNSTLTQEDSIAYLSGDLGTGTYLQVKELIEHHPEVKQLVLTNISGSVNDAMNLHTSRIVHESGIQTKVTAQSQIASGGVDLFCAGQERIVESGAKIGVHSWCCVGNQTAIELPKDHPAHQYQLNYFSTVMGKINGPAFYYYTLEAAPFDGVHWMTDEEIQKWNVATQFNK